MKRSTGGRVRRDKTSVNDGSLFLLLFAHSSCCIRSWSPSMATTKTRTLGDLDDGRRRRREGGEKKGKRK